MSHGGARNTINKMDMLKHFDGTMTAQCTWEVQGLHIILIFVIIVNADNVGLG
jgi:hypothetical protein